MTERERRSLFCALKQLSKSQKLDLHIVEFVIVKLLIAYFNNQEAYFLI